jgi:hypothetical protein
MHAFAIAGSGLIPSRLVISDFPIRTRDGMDQLRQLQTTLCADPKRIRILGLIRGLGLRDCWVAAGFVRSAIWDRQHKRTHSPLPPDIDVIWFDETLHEPAIDTGSETHLLRSDSSLNWSVKNQARMRSGSTVACHTA